MRRAALFTLFGSVVTAMVVASHAPTPSRVSRTHAGVAPGISRVRPDAAAEGEAGASTRHLPDAHARRPVWLRPVPPALRYGGREQDAFDEAIAPWQAGNYGGAAVRLDALARQHPDDLALEFYRGAAWLLAGAPREALGPLRRVVDRSTGTRRAEAAWYLGLAQLARGERAQALDDFDAACVAGASQGCRALAWLRAKPQS